MRWLSAAEQVPDPADHDLAALALTMQVPIWGRDKHFDALEVPAFKTGQLLALFGL